MKKNIVDTLIEQHKILQNELDVILDLCVDTRSEDCKEIFSTLKKLEIDLVNHLKLENETFYVQLLEKMEQKGLNTQDTVKFRDEMNVIGKEVYDFFGKFKEEALIKNNISGFKKDFVGIREAIILRVESEEAGVFMYWSFFE
ncbi:MAG: hypothetical protein HQ536_02790 [Parcubacteria group bacterium]|nr:hypothetical protein [Parcubacteria group bacterium]